MKNRISTYIISGLVILAIIGLLSKLMNDPVDFIKGIAVMLIVLAVIFFVFQRMYTPSPAKREQQAFVKAAKRSVKRNQLKETGQQFPKKKKSSNLTPIKKTKMKKKPQHTPQLTVIEGRKGKKKNRASFL